MLEFSQATHGGEVPPSKVFIHPETIRIVHDTIWEGEVNIFTVHGGFTVAKDEAFREFFRGFIKNKSFKKSHTRFGSKELNEAGVFRPWEEGDRYLFYYHQSLPRIEFDDMAYVFLLGQKFTIELLTQPQG
jgi:hypothetical protein